MLKYFFVYKFNIICIVCVVLLGCNGYLLKSNNDIKQTAEYKTNSERVFAAPSRKVFLEKDYNTLNKPTPITLAELNDMIETIKKSFDVVAKAMNKTNSLLNFK